MEKKGILLFSILFFMIFLLYKPVYAIGAGAGYHYVDGGTFYSDVSIPLDVAKAVNFDNSEKNFVPVSNNKSNAQERKNLKMGEASSKNILGLVEWGNAGIYKAAQNGKIKKIHYVEVTKEKVYIPLVFIPIYFTRYLTTVYGE